MDDGADAAQRVPERGRIGEVAEHELDPHPVGAEAPRIAHQAAHGLRPREQRGEQRGADAAGGTGEQEHAADHRMRVSTRRTRPRTRYPPMAYVIAEPCIGTKDNSCVEVCPVDCIHPTPDEPDYDKVEMLFIDPEECIDCDACVEACPVDACFAEDQLPDEWAQFAERNAAYFAGK